MINDASWWRFPLVQQLVQDVEIEAGKAFLPDDLFQDFAGVAKAGKGLAIQERSVHQLVKPCSRAHRAPSRLPLSTVET